MNHAGDVLVIQKDILEMIAREEPLGRVAELLCHRIEALSPGTICSVMTCGPGGVLRVLAAPSLPADYLAAIDGVVAGPIAGSCGTSAFLGEAVEVSDIATDPRWADYRDLAARYGLKACWSNPAKARDRRVMGTVAFYAREARGPDAVERGVIDACLQLCAIAMEREEARARTHRLAYFDEATALPNRLSFTEALHARLRSVPSAMGLLLIDLDHLKLVNDTLGHAAADAIIRRVAERLPGCRPGVSAFRIGGDEFALLLDDDDLEATAEAVQRRLEEAVPHRGLALHPHVTIGGAAWVGGVTAETLIQNADIALAHAKAKRRGGFVRFNGPLKTATLRRTERLTAVRQALAEGRTLAHYQPIVRLDDRKIGGFEALTRIRMPDGRIADAAEFHTVFNDARIACTVTDRTLAQVARDIRAWLDAGLALRYVGVNVSAADCERDDLEERVVRAFEQASVPLRYLTLEVTETVALGSGEASIVRMLAGLRARGVRIALDDFGTGFGSLTHLLTLPVDIVKIDRTFVAGLEASAAKASIVGGMLKIAADLGLKVICEGVETEAQASALKRLGATAAQGYLFGRPAAIERATARLAEGASSPPARPSAPALLRA